MFYNRVKLEEQSWNMATRRVEIPPGPEHSEGEEAVNGSKLMRRMPHLSLAESGF